MAASDHLNPTQFFHGTDADLPVGGHLLPPIDTGVEPRSHPDIDPHEFDNSYHVYFTNNQQHAHDFAHDRGGKNVYEVQPHGHVEEDPESEMFGMKGLYRASRATIIRKL